MAKSRRGNNEGYVGELPDGTWRGYVHLGRKADGSPDRRWFRGKSKAEVNQERKRLLALMDAGLPIKADKRTVSEYLLEWLETEVKQTTSPRTYDSYSQLCRLYIVPALGRVPLAALEGRQVRAFETALAQQPVRRTGKPMSVSTVRYCHRMLKSALNRSVVNGLLPRNPMDVVMPPKRRPQEANYLSLKEVHTLLAQARGTRIEALLTLAVTVGMRQGEILGLRWDQVDLDCGALSVMRASGRSGGKLQLTAPKNKSSIRSIVLPASTVASLRAHHTRQREERTERRGWKDQNLVFPDTRGGLYDAGNMVKLFHKALREAGMRHINFHALRHTAASLMLAQGIPLHVVSRILGHSSIAITADLYGHLYDPTKQAAAESMDILFGGISA